jgi:hypothetical protein
MHELMEQRAEQLRTRSKVKMFSMGALIGFLWGAICFKPQ